MSTNGYKKYLETDERSNNPERPSEEYQDNQQEYQNGNYGSMQQSVSKIANFEVQIKNLTPIANSIRQQNLYLKDQKQKIEKQLHSLCQMSNLIKNQNEAMIQHFKQRKIDLQQVISTFTINNSEDMSDLDHLSYSYREHNRMLNTEIDSLDKEIKMMQKNNSNCNRQIQQLVQQNIKLQKVLMFRKAHTDKNNKTLAKEKQSLNSVLKLDQLEQEVANLCYEVGQAKSNNLKTINNLLKNKFQLEVQKPNKKKQTVQKIKQKVYLNGESENLSSQILQLDNKLDQYTQMDKEVTAKIQKVLGQNEKKRINISLLCEKIRKEDELSQKAQKNISILKNQAQQKQYIVNNLLKEMGQLEYGQFKNEENIKMKQLEIQMKLEKEVSEIKQQIERSSSGVQNQLGSSIFKTKRENQKKISNLRYELSILEKRSKQLEEMIKSKRDPIKDIRLLENKLAQQAGK